ncbi:BACON domain-containing protein [Paludibaculum fermentans]|uniref:BACON domain-containing protein n=1 Tax=Paludibaculum fermentans TaxID=1473598 RepID=UPI003EBF2289
MKSIHEFLRSYALWAVFLLATAGSAYQAPCRISAPEPRLHVSADGGTTELPLVSDGKGCKFEETYALSWVRVSILPPGSTGAPYVMRYHVAQNRTPQARTVALHLGDRDFEFAQAPGQPRLAVGPGRVSISAKAGGPVEAKKLLTVWSEDGPVVARIQVRGEDRDWLSVEPTSDPRKFEVRVRLSATTQLPRSGLLYVSADSTANGPISVPVDVTPGQ